LAGLARGEILVIWEDDDIYLPWHISAHVVGLCATKQFSKPSRILCHLNDELQEYNAAGRFHGSISFTRSALCEIRGWPLTLRGDFDQTFMGQLAKLGHVADSLSAKGPSYIFRGASTQNYHGQS
jgi:shikimate kinase